MKVSLPAGIDLDAVFDNPQSVSKKKRKENGYSLFLKIRRHQISEDEPAESSREFHQRIDQEWRQMSHDMRENYKDIAKNRYFERYFKPGELRILSPERRLSMPAIKEDPVAELLESRHYVKLRLIQIRLKLDQVISSM